MQEERFRSWLSVERQLDPRTVGSRISNCRRVEPYEGNLDDHYDVDELAGLLDRLRPGAPKHGIEIKGDIYNGTATLRSAVRLYRDYRKAAGGPAGRAAVAAKPRPREQRPRRLGADWSAWSQPSEKDLLELARAMVRFVRFLDPGIVGAVTEENQRLRAEWSSRLEALGIDPGIYLWEGSPCAFPGIRRYAGSTEIAAFRRRTTLSELPAQCLKLDDNDYPKQLWAFVFTGKRFSKRGPDGYQLAHLLDHKEHGNRWRDELDLPSDVGEPAPLYGLFTSAANTVYAPAAFLRPTDFSPRLRSLIQRRALALYGNLCRVVPPPLAIRPCDDPDWDLGKFDWAEPVGSMDHVPAFLEFRRKRMGELMNRN